MLQLLHSWPVGDDGSSAGVHLLDGDALQGGHLRTDLMATEVRNVNERQVLVLQDMHLQDHETLVLHVNMRTIHHIVCVD